MILMLQRKHPRKLLLPRKTRNFVLDKFKFSICVLLHSCVVDERTYILQPAQK
jgi:hypothetical protein